MPASGEDTLTKKFIGDHLVFFCQTGVVYKKGQSKLPLLPVLDVSTKIMVHCFQKIKYVIWKNEKKKKNQKAPI